MSEQILPEELLEELTEKLEDRLHSLREDLSRLEESTFTGTQDLSGDLSSLSEHNADKGTDVYEQTRGIDEMKREQKELDQVQDALDKLKKKDTPEYGICESCAALIDEDRLKSIPYTPYCIDCAKESEEKTGGV